LPISLPIGPPQRRQGEEEVPGIDPDPRRLRHQGPQVDGDGGGAGHRTILSDGAASSLDAAQRILYSFCIEIPPRSPIMAMTTFNVDPTMEKTLEELKHHYGA